VLRASFAGALLLRVGRSTAVDVNRISAFQVLADLPATELNELAAMMTEVNLEAGAKILQLDEYGTAVYFVEHGEAVVRIDGGEVDQTLGPGDMFGEIALLLTGERTADVVARTPMKLLSLSGQDFEYIRERVPEFERRLRLLGSDRAGR
jgi:CRP-like cAMP-binding protein